MSGGIIVLPDHREMLRRLLEVADNAHLQQKLYPTLLDSAGQELFPEGVVLLLSLAINNCVEDLRSDVVRVLLYMLAPKFIEVLVDDPVNAEQAKTILRQTLSAE